MLDNLRTASTLTKFSTAWTLDFIVTKIFQEMMECEVTVVQFLTELQQRFFGGPCKGFILVAEREHFLGHLVAS